VDFSDLLVVADMEAGIGTLTRLAEKQMDVVLIVVEATPKSLEVAKRAAELAAANGQGRVIIVANRIRNEGDLATIKAAFPGAEVVAIPDDPAIVAADRNGKAPLDVAPDAPAVRSLEALAQSLVPAPG